MAEENTKISEDFEGDSGWDSELIFIIIWFGIIVVFMVFILAVMCIRTRALSTLADHKTKVGRNHKLNPGQRPTKVVGFFHPNW